jgi:hypothetical protein
MSSRLHPLEIPILSSYIRIRFDSKTSLPLFKSSTFRGVLGHVLREEVCTQSKTQVCEACPIHGKCTFSWLFEGLILEPNPHFSLSHAPPPFRIEVFENCRQEFEEDSTLDLRLTLFGEGIRYLGLFLTCLDRAGKDFGVGVGHLDGSGRFHRQLVWSATEGVELARGENLPASVDARPLRELLGELTRSGFRRLHFLSPLQFKMHGKKWKNPKDQVALASFVAASQRRLYLLAHHAGFNQDWTYEESLSLCSDLVAEDMRWYEMQRFSNRSQCHKPLSGLLGWLLYSVDSTEADPWLLALEHIGLGGQTSMGLGSFSLSTR